MEFELKLEATSGPALVKELGKIKAAVAASFPDVDPRAITVQVSTAGGRRRKLLQATLIVKVIINVPKAKAAAIATQAQAQVQSGAVLSNLKKAGLPVTGVALESAPVVLTAAPKQAAPSPPAGDDDDQIPAIAGGAAGGLLFLLGAVLGLRAWRKRAAKRQGTEVDDQAIENVLSSSPERPGPAALAPAPSLFESPESRLQQSGRSRAPEIELADQGGMMMKLPSLLDTPSRGGRQISQEAGSPSQPGTSVVATDLTSILSTAPTTKKAGALPPLQGRVTTPSK